jgi:hypothetical protein
MAILGRRARPRPPEKKLSANSYKPSLANKIIEAPAMFYGNNSIMGDTREIWFIHGGFLYEVTTYKQLDSWLAPIMQTWQFTP